MTLIELFSGCGGLTLGAKRAGYNTKLAVDVDPILSSSFGINFPGVPFLRADVRDLGRDNLREYIEEGIDGVVGGPPCQGFSGIGKGDVKDPRRSLLKEFFRVVELVRPKFFLMENVPGLIFPNNRPELDLALSILGGNWDVIGPVVLDAADFGAATRRKRVFVFGFDRERVTAPLLEDIVKGDFARVCVQDAIEDLQGAKLDKNGMWRYVRKAKSPYSYKMRCASGRFTGHQLTSHKEETVQRYSRIKPGDVDPVGKHKRLEWSGFCPTLRAGTGADRGSYQSVRPLHPKEHRVITPREGARLQGFPDGFIFHETVWHSFRMIGNSVSPIIAEVLLRNIKEYIEGASGSFSNTREKTEKLLSGAALV